MQTLLQDLRYGIRTLLRQRGFTFIAVLTLALGISASTTIFSVVNAVLLRELPFKDPSRLMTVWETFLNYPGIQNTVAPANFNDERKAIVTRVLALEKSTADFNDRLLIGRRFVVPAALILKPRA